MRARCDPPLFIRAVGVVEIFDVEYLRLLVGKDCRRIIERYPMLAKVCGSFGCVSLKFIMEGH